MTNRNGGDSIKKFISIICTLIVTICVLSVATISTSANNNQLLGDANSDNKVNIKDATTIQKYIASIINLSDDELSAGDVDGNYRFNIKDATAIQKWVAGISLDYPIGEPMKSEEESTTTKPNTDFTTPTIPDVPSDSFAPPDNNLSDPVTAEMLAKVEAGFYRLVNEERVSHGLKPLTYNKHLDDVAQIRSKDIMTSFSHTRPNGESFSSLINSNEYFWRSLGENICINSHIGASWFDPSEDAFVGSDEQITAVYTNIFNAFKNSPGHYDNMMNENFENTGIGIEVRGWSEDLPLPYFYVSHVFGKTYN